MERAIFKMVHLARCSEGRGRRGGVMALFGESDPETEGGGGLRCMVLVLAGGEGLIQLERARVPT